EFPEQKALAVDLLGLSAIEVTEALKAKAERAIAIQINYQVESGLFAEVYQRMKMGDRDYEFRSPQGATSQVAQGLVDQIIATIEASVPVTESGYSIVSSLR